MKGGCWGPVSGPGQLCGGKGVCWREKVRPARSCERYGAEQTRVCDGATPMIGLCNGERTWECVGRGGIEVTAEDGGDGPVKEVVGCGFMGLNV